MGMYMFMQLRVRGLEHHDRQPRDSAKLEQQRHGDRQCLVAERELVPGGAEVDRGLHPPKTGHVWPGDRRQLASRDPETKRGEQHTRLCDSSPYSSVVAGWPAVQASASIWFSKYPMELCYIWGKWAISA
jgi:hypothetical protein